MSFSTASFVGTDFIDYLADRTQISDKQRPVSNEWARVGNTIGALALRLNLLDADQVDKLLQAQEEQGGYFGELAVKSGYLQPSQVCKLLEIQSLHDQIFLSEQLVVDGKLELPELIEHLSVFLNEGHVLSVGL